MLSLLRTRMPQRAVPANIGTPVNADRHASACAPLLSVQADESRMAAPSIEGMLRELPFKTIGDVGRHGLELHFYCSRCFAFLALGQRQLGRAHAIQEQEIESKEDKLIRVAFVHRRLEPAEYWNT